MKSLNISASKGGYRNLIAIGEEGKNITAPDLRGKVSCIPKTTFYSLKCLNGYCVFSKFYSIFESGSGHSTKGILAISLGLPTTSLGSGTMIVELLDKVMECYQQTYLIDEYITNNIREDATLFQAILDEYQFPPSFKRIATSPINGQYAFVKYKNKEDLNSYFSYLSFYKNEIEEYETIYFVEEEIHNDSKLHFSFSNLTEISLSLSPVIKYKIQFYDPHTGDIKIIKNNALEEDIIEIDQSKKGYHNYSLYSSVENLLTSTFKNIEIDNNTHTITISGKFKPIEKTIKFIIRYEGKVIDSPLQIKSDSLPETCKDIQSGNTSVVFTGEEIYEKWKIIVEETEKYERYETSIYPDFISDEYIIELSPKITKPVSTTIPVSPPRNNSPSKNDTKEQKVKFTLSGKGIEKKIEKKKFEAQICIDDTSFKHIISTSLIQKLKPGKHTVVVKAEGYELSETHFEINSKKNEEILIELKEDEQTIQNKSIYKLTGLLVLSFILGGIVVEGSRYGYMKYSPQTLISDSTSNNNPVEAENGSYQLLLENDTIKIDITFNRPKENEIKDKEISFIQNDSSFNIQYVNDENKEETLLDIVIMNKKENSKNTENEKLNKSRSSKPFDSQKINQDSIDLIKYLRLLNKVEITLEEVNEIKHWYNNKKNTLKKEWITEEVKKETFVEDIENLETKIESTRFFLEECILKFSLSYVNMKKLQQKLPKDLRMRVEVFHSGKLHKDSIRRYSKEELKLVYETLDRDTINNIEKFYLSIKNILEKSPQK